VRDGNRTRQGDIQTTKAESNPRRGSYSRVRGGKGVIGLCSRRWKTKPMTRRGGGTLEGAIYERGIRVACRGDKTVPQ